LHSAKGEILLYQDSELISCAKPFSRTSRRPSHSSDDAGQKLACVYFQDGGKLLPKDEAWRIAANIRLAVGVGNRARMSDHDPSATSQNEYKKISSTCMFG
jgi:hypothetical protein